MDKEARGFAKRIADDLAGIKQIVHDVGALPHGSTDKSDQHEQQPQTPSKAAGIKPKTFKERYREWAIKWKPVCEIIALGVVAATTSLTWLQWQAVNETNRIMRDNLVIAYRAYLAVKGIETTPPDGRSVVAILIENHGHVPVSQLSQFIEYERDKSDKTPIQKYGMSAKAASQDVAINPGDADPWRLIVALPRFSPDQWRAIESTEIQTIRGHIGYENGFGKTERLPICAARLPSGSGWVLCANALGAFVDFSTARQ